MIEASNYEDRPEFKREVSETVLLRVLEATDQDLQAKRGFDRLKKHVRSLWEGTSYEDIQIEFEGYLVSIKAPPFFEKSENYSNAKKAFQQQERIELIFVVDSEGKRVLDRDQITEVLFKLLNDRNIHAKE